MAFSLLPLFATAGYYWFRRDIDSISLFFISVVFGQCYCISQAPITLPQKLQGIVITWVLLTMVCWFIIMMPSVSTKSSNVIMPAIPVIQFVHALIFIDLLQVKSQN